MSLITVAMNHIRPHRTHIYWRKSHILPSNERQMINIPTQFQIVFHLQRTTVSHWFGKILWPGKHWFELESILEIVDNLKCQTFNCRRLEAPDVTGSSLTLGAAGSRRTVYLVDENSKLPDSTAQSDSEMGTNNRNSTTISNNNTSKSSNNNNHSTSHDQSPSTFLMYNRISNVIGDPKVVGSNNSVLNDNASNGNGGRERKENDGHIWYEYGCV